MRLGLVLLATTTACRSLFGFADVSLEQAEVDAAPIDTSPACADSDGDGVCDEVDVCPGFDDAADVDGDGVPDGCDSWPCGPEPDALVSVTFDEMEMGNHATITLSNTSLDGGPVLLVVSPGQMFDVAASYSIIDCICPNCFDQIEVGLVPGTDKKCLFNNNPTDPCTVPTTGAQTRSFTAPSTPGRYDVRFALGQDFGCNSTTTTWFRGEPGAANTFATICVRP